MTKLSAFWRCRWIAVAAILWVAPPASSLPSFGTNVDQHCTNNQREPATPYAGDCAICHNAADSGRDRTPLFSAYKSGDLDAFCPPNANLPPQFEAINDPSVSEDAILSLRVVATDPDGDALALEAADLPTGAIFADEGSGVGQLVWMPSFDQAGSHRVTFKATDNGTPPESAMALVTITVGNVNRPPALGAIGNRTVAAGELLSVVLTATDPDGDGLEFGAVGVPATAVLSDFGGGSGRLDWTPTASDVGNHTLTISVTDNGVPIASDSEEVTITVGENVNRPPLLDPIGDRTVVEGELWSISLGANDPDGDGLLFSCDGAPAGAVLDDAGDGSGSLSGGPDPAGNHTVTCAVTDSGQPPLSASETFTLTIGNVNRPPVLEPVSMIRDGDRVFVPLVAQDPDGDALSFSAAGMPEGAELLDRRDGTAEFTWQPPADLAGDYKVVFMVTDDGSPPESASQALTISLQGNQSAIALRKAHWHSKRDVLRVEGKAPASASVEILDAGNGTVLGKTSARRDGRFRARLSLDAAPCAIRAAAEGEQSAVMAVEDAPNGCGGSAPTLPDDEDEDDDGGEDDEDEDDDEEDDDD